MSFKEFMIEEVEQEPIEYVASKKFKDEEGNPIPWKLKPLTAKEIEIIRKQCTYNKPTGKRGQYIPTLDMPKFTTILAEKCVVYPDLNNKELQDFYHVMGVEDLLKEHLLKLPGEYDDFTEELQRINGYELDEAVEEAKN